ncbi:uncharacterized protein LOC121765775 [Salvia splendens]|uniref:uncharacterized protein LOC121765775 n=1 Tax=Salvia splendens TaxID=180675 RepID=UPI001C25A806|nr:uncharacterized protein LOC121765775 [Salvia splendens]
MKLFGKHIDTNGNLSRSPTDETDDTSSMDETSTSRRRKLATKNSNQEDVYPLEFFMKPFGDIDMGESSPEKRELTTTSSNQVNGLSLELSLGPNGHVDTDSVRNFICKKRRGGFEYLHQIRTLRKKRMTLNQVMVLRVLHS